MPLPSSDHHLLRQLSVQRTPYSLDLRSQPACPLLCGARSSNVRPLRCLYPRVLESHQGSPKRLILQFTAALFVLGKASPKHVAEVETGLMAVGPREPPKCCRAPYTVPESADLGEDGHATRPQHPSNRPSSLNTRLNPSRKQRTSLSPSLLTTLLSRPSIKRYSTVFYHDVMV